MKYRHKPTEIEAFRVVESNIQGEKANFPTWAWVAMLSGRLKALTYVRRLQVTTPHGDVDANAGDWILASPYEELYVFSDAAFTALYEPVPVLLPAKVREEPPVGLGPGL